MSILTDLLFVEMVYGDTANITQYNYSSLLIPSHVKLQVIESTVLVQPVD